MRPDIAGCLQGPVATNEPGVPFQVIVEDERLVNDSGDIHQFLQGTPGSAGFDLTVWPKEPVLLEPGDDAILLPTGVRLWINYPGIVGLIFPRSGSGHKRGLVLGNGTGVIDSDYQGPLGVSLVNRSSKPEVVNPGERVAQIVFVPVAFARFNVTEQFYSSTDRASGGFGSTGR